MQPDRFIFAGSMSGAFEAPHRAEAAPGFDWEILGPSVTRAFGERGSARRTSGDVIRSINEAGGDLPYFYMDCGIEDGFLPINRLVSRLLKHKGFQHEYHESPGGHDWRYWDTQLARMLDVFEENLLLK
jgi:S-formylglutathione hydrolase